ncbi:putative secreted RxLR effector protein [Phytophthora cinnamomi]|uniref:putative secreted RxLR effector protein n=1 Tax=Phytophthora cinnamomi TaxID=4785 RepID=UPI0035599FD9|nr:putative secreted RxLR effector protein [Phytophthora cinnamomi]
MRLLCIALVVATGLFASSDGARVDKNIQVSTPIMPNVASRRRALTTDQSAVVVKRFLRVAETLDSGGIESTGSSSKTSAYPAPSGNDQEERTIKLPSSIAKLFKDKKVPTAVMDLFKSNKNMMTPAKLRVKMLEKLPPELAAELIFLKPPKRLLPTNVPAKLPSKLPSKIKAQVFKIPGVADVTIRL